MKYFSAKTEMWLTYIAASLDVTDKELQRLHERLSRFSYQIRQPRKDDRSCNKTPFFDRWDINPGTSYLTPKDPRFASQQECEHVYHKLLALLLQAHDAYKPSPQAIKQFEQIAGCAFQPESLSCVHTGKPILRKDITAALGYVTPRLGAYEIPVSYCLELNAGGKHHHTNIGWMKPMHINYQLRKTLKTHLAQSGANTKAINNILDKIQVKAYCTDKVTMPPFFSNRDVRWATWTESYQYASHYQCALIEMELLVELFEFANAPMLDDVTVSAIENIRRHPVLPETRRCFITGRMLDFLEYVESAVHSEGGKSAYHVGHLVPLTRGGVHVWNNVAWMSDDGNRIQGNDTIHEIESKLVDAVEYHMRQDLELSPKEYSKSIAEQTSSNQYTAHDQNNARTLNQTFYDKVKKLWKLLNDIRERLGKSRSPW